MQSKALHLALSVGTVALSVVVLEQLSHAASRQFKPMPVANDGLKLQSTAWVATQSGQTSEAGDLLKTPLGSLDAKILDLAVLYGWDAAWFQQLLPEAVKMTCGVNFAALPEPQQIAQANWLAFRLASSLSADALKALGTEAKMRKINEELPAKVKASPVTPAALKMAFVERLKVIVPGPKESDMMLTKPLLDEHLHYHLLDDVLEGRAPQPTTYVVEGSSCPPPTPVPNGYPQPGRPVRVAVVR